MRLVAHREFASTAPENTIAALAGAADSGADAAVFDVRRCATGDLVVVHVEPLDRVADSSGPSPTPPLADLRNLPV